MIIRLKGVRTASPKEFADRKVSIAAAVMGLMISEELFRPAHLEIWEGGISEAEGGRLVREIEMRGWGPAGFRNYIVSEILDRMVPSTKATILVNGTLLTRTEEYPSYIAIHCAPKERAIYGDIEFDVWPTGKAEGIFDIYFRDPEFKAIFRSMMGRLVGRITAKLDYIVEGYSPDASWNVTEWILYYSPEKKAIVKNIFKTVKYLAELEESDRELKFLAKLIKPYKEEFFATALFEIRGFKEKLEAIASESNVHLDLSRSISFAAEDPNAPKNFFNTFKHKFLDPLKDILIDEERIRSALQRIVRETRPLEF